MNRQHTEPQLDPSGPGLRGSVFAAKGSCVSALPRKRFVANGLARFSAD